MKILVVNIGNSRTAAGWYTRGKVRRSARTEAATPVILEAVANEETPDVVFMASVVPAANRTWTRLVRATFPRVPVFWMDHRMELGIRVDLKRPDQTGHDRFADAAGGADLCGTPCIVCDFGTATTFNVVLPRRGFIGGAIVPGYGMWFEALGRAAQLPQLKPRGIKLKTGRNTEEAIRAGARWGYQGMVAEILRQLARTCGRREPVLCATGGYAKAVVAHAGLKMPVIPDLTLHGLARICERNVEEI
ncbi:MAG TPA: type III pantothenate kinase [Kiritimatiellia bacterium]|nr:type III pantothenate kinase [Kiritimatiellia bacterium]HPJ56268.1 type III pantothenate kinase [Kiritimatiellia bacterium]HPR68484.1 type III pantothenate kinase [Kiritimatiellia bacterium]HRX06434.1 type III pantothenate kinase [Kiritimatiellia bacterium]